MNLKSKLEIILVTYNREKHLAHTLQQLFSDTSPVKEFNIVILDNHSTDGTEKVIQAYQKRFKNLKHICHPRNIGGNANITRAYEMASQEYLWVLCDDDELDWSHWNEVEDAINKEKADLVVVANYLDPQYNKAQLIKQLTFVPAGIYKTKYISDSSIINAYYNISNMFPQMSIFAEYFIQNLKVVICPHSIIKMVPHCGEDSYVRGAKEDKAHPYMKNNGWYFGFVNAIQVFPDCKFREYLIQNMNLEAKDSSVSGMDLYKFNKKYCHQNLTNITDYFCALTKKQKIKFCWELLSPVIMYTKKNSLNLRLFWAVKIQLWNKKWFSKKPVK